MHAVFTTVLTAFAVTGCGGSASGEVEQTPLQKVGGPGFTFSAPEDREIARTPRSVTVLPAEESSQELESVTVFPLVKPYRPALWPQAAKELDGVAGRLADSLGGERDGSRRPCDAAACAGGYTRSPTNARASNCASG